MSTRTGSSRPAHVPSATYRLQLRKEFSFGDAGQVADYLAALGVSHLYYSPVLSAVPGSSHGYDVIDHTELAPDLGGAPAFAQLRERLTSLGLRAVADVVPNHMAVPTPLTLNPALWSVLREGQESPYAGWFDIDWSAPLLTPVLGQHLGDVLDAGEITLDRDGGDIGEPALRYYDHVYPVRPGTVDLPLEELLDRQHYRLAYWRVADEELNYRRFFDVDTLAGLRVEDPGVFAETHALLIALVNEGGLDGLRIDHPDGLADPRTYLQRLARATGGAWVVVEKILEGEEDLPADWYCAGTTGYDALLRVGGLFCDPAAEAPLTALYAELTGDTVDFDAVVLTAKREVVEHGLYAEVARLVELAAAICQDDIRLRDHTRRGLREVLVELLVAVPVYRAYVVPGEPASPAAVEVLDTAADLARSRLAEERHGTLELVRQLVLGHAVGGHGRDAHRDEFVVRFQQTCGPVMAKGVEDTAFYRWYRLSSLNEVGGDPGTFAVDAAAFHAWCGEQQRTWPAAMTTLSTHDTKRSEDVRARISALTQVPLAWGEAVMAWQAAATAHRPAELDPATEYLLWQTLVGTWSGGPIAPHRLHAYLEKATREAKQHTTWTTPDEAYDSALVAFTDAVLTDDALLASVGAFCRDHLDAAARVGVLGQKLVQLTMPGVPDVYQGTELVELSLVDPDNRRPVDYAARRALLARLDGGWSPATDGSDLDAEKLLVTSRALRLRREHPDWFGVDATYEPVAVSGAPAIAFRRGGALTVALRSLLRPDADLGTVVLPTGRWRDVLSGTEQAGGERPLAGMLAARPVALLVLLP